MAKSKIYVGLEIGTSKICMAVGETKPDGSISIIGTGEVKSVGVKKGEIVDMAQARQCILDAWDLAQQHADVDILAVYLAVTGARIIGKNNRGTFRLPDGDGVITEEHMKEVDIISKEIPLSKDDLIIHKLPGNYIVDGNDQNPNPVGLSGRTLDKDCHIVYGPKANLTNFWKCAREVPLDVEAVVFAPIAGSLAVVKHQNREAGCLFVDIGGGTTDYCLYWEGHPIASGCIPVGGDHVTNDIHLTTGISIHKSELLKRAEGNAYPAQGESEGIAKIPADETTSEVALDRKVLNRIIQDRIYETFMLVKKRLPDFAQENLRGGIFLSGGTSLMRGVAPLVSSIFKSDVYAESVEASGVTSSLEDPRFHVAIGLIRYAQCHDESQVQKKSVFSRVFGWLGR